tara:strand:- start:9502 stop:9723 length:222 start_codon:yes stop_codon:yes gene_type:complete
MSREQLSNFLYAAERNLFLKKEIYNASSFEKIKSIAEKYGFKINYIDLQEDFLSEKINNWFIDSKINPLRRIH